MHESITSHESSTGGGGGGGPCRPSEFSNVSCRCLYMLVITVAIWPREVVSCREFILRAVATFWAMSLIGIYPNRASTMGTNNFALKLSLAIIG